MKQDMSGFFIKCCILSPVNKKIGKYVSNKPAINKESNR